MIQLQQGAAYSDNQRDVSEAAFEADAVEVVIWTSFERPGGLRTLLEEINNYPTETTRRRPPIGYPPSGTTSPAFPVSVLVARRPPSERSASRDGEAPGSNGAEFHTTIGEA
jgi:hypothetical protein